MKTTLGRCWLSLFLTLVMCLTLAPAVRAEDEEDTEPTAPALTGVSVTLPKQETVIVDDSISLTADVAPTPADASLDGVTYQWFIDRAIAEVTTKTNEPRTNVKGIYPGTATITVYAIYDERSLGSATCEITVEEALDDLRLSTSSIVMDVGTDRTITATTKSDSATVIWTYKDYKDTEGDEKAVDVRGTDTKGRTANIHGQHPGTGTIYATIGEGTNSSQRTVEITISGMVLADKDKTMEVTENRSNPLPIPERYGNAAPEGVNVYWQSADPGIAEISGNNVMGRGPGTTTITGSVRGNYQVTITVTVKVDPTATIPESMKTSERLSFSAIAERIKNEQAGGELSHVTGMFVSPAQGTLYYKYASPDEPNAGVAQLGSYYYAPSAGQNSLRDITFVPNPTFTGSQVTISYTVITTNGQSRSCRILISMTQDQNAVIDLSTTNTEPAWFSGIYFDRHCQQKTGASLDYVIFSLPPESKGVLYAGYTNAGNYGSKVTSSTMYRLAQLDSIVFVPAAGIVPAVGADPQKVTIYYTAYSTNGKNHNGQVNILISRENTSTGTHVLYDVPKNSTKTFHDDDFSTSLDASFNGRVLNFILFDTLPSPQEGVLYYGYRSVSNPGTRVQTDTAYYCGTRSPRLDQIAFVPAQDFTGNIRISFTAWDVDMNRFSGSLEINVQSGSGGGDVQYSCTSSRSVRFVNSDFTKLCSGSTLDYIIFRDLPDRTTEGSIYLDGNRIGSTGTRYYSSGSGNRIRDLSFRAVSGFSGLVTIPFTGYTTSNTTFDAVITIDVSSSSLGNTTISYKTEKGAVIVFDRDYFDEISRNETNYGISYVRFVVPSTSQGDLYQNYRSSSNKGTRISSSSTSIYASGLDSVAFIPNSNYTGTVYIDYTATAQGRGVTFVGTIEIVVSWSSPSVTDPSTTSSSFTDLSGYTNAQRTAVEYIYVRGITAGITYTQYGPELPIRRGDFARMVYIAFGFTPGSSSWAFNDVPPDRYYAQAVNALYDRGVVSGVGNGDFAPEANVSRQDAACMIQRAIRATGRNASDGPYSALSGYYDGSFVSDYAQGAMAMVVQRGYLPVSGAYLDPRRPLTRIEMAEILYRALTY